VDHERASVCGGTTLGSFGFGCFSADLFDGVLHIIGEYGFHCDFYVVVD
jgi:hypothetical protein